MDLSGILFRCLCALGAGIVLWSATFSREPFEPATVDPTALFEGGRWRGSVDAPVRMLVFSDFTCVACRAWANSALRDVDAELVREGLVAIGFRHFLVNLEDLGSHHPSIAAACAGAQGRFWDAHDLLLQEPASGADSLADRLVGLVPTEFESCLRSNSARKEVLGDQELGKELGVAATPTAYYAVRGPTGFRLMNRTVGGISATELVAILRGLATEAPGLR